MKRNTFQLVWPLLRKPSRLFCELAQLSTGLIPALLLVLFILFALLFFLIFSISHMLFFFVSFFSSKSASFCILPLSFSFLLDAVSSLQTLLFSPLPFIFLFSSSFPLWWRSFLFYQSALTKETPANFLSVQSETFFKETIFYCNSKYAPTDTTTSLNSRS